MSPEKKTTEMKRYEKETGKQAIWHGNVTESFKRWQEEKEVYEDTDELETITKRYWDINR